MEGALRGHRLGWVRVTRAVLESWRAMVSWTFEAPAVVSDGVTVTNVRIASAIVANSTSDADNRSIIASAIGNDPEPDPLHVDEAWELAACEAAAVVERAFAAEQKAQEVEFTQEDTIGFPSDDDSERDVVGNSPAYSSSGESTDDGDLEESRRSRLRTSSSESEETRELLATPATYRSGHSKVNVTRAVLKLVSSSDSDGEVSSPQAALKRQRQHASSDINGTSKLHPVAVAHAVAVGLSLWALLCVRCF